MPHPVSASLPPRPRPEPALAETTFLFREAPPASPPPADRKIPVAIPVPASSAAKSGNDLHALIGRFNDWWTPLRTRTKVVLVVVAAFVGLRFLRAGDGVSISLPVFGVIIAVAAVAALRGLGWLGTSKVAAQPARDPATAVRRRGRPDSAGGPPRASAGLRPPGSAAWHAVIRRAVRCPRKVPAIK